MSQSPFQVDAATLHGAAKDVRATRTEVDGQLKSLGGVVDELAVAWQGSASGGFQQLMTRWNGDVIKLLHAMDEIADLLDKSGTTHSANDEQQQQALGRIHQALNP
jgi:WXG100 family type VII secretion target